jgi:hypothetical protein
MARNQTAKTEARTPTTLVFDESAGEVIPSAGFAGVPLEAIIKNAVNGDKRAKVAPLCPEADSDIVRDFHGENSVSDWDVTVINNKNGASFTSIGMTEIGAGEFKSSTSSITLTALLHEMGGLQSPQARKIAEVVVEAAGMRANGASKAEVDAFYAANELNWSADTERKNTLLDRVRMTTKKWFAAKTTITRNN